MTIPLPTSSVLALALILAAFTWASRFITVFPPLYAMRQGLRASLLPAINLAQVSEFSLVLMQIGVQSGHTTPGDRRRRIHRLRRARGDQHVSDDAQRRR